MDLAKVDIGQDKLDIFLTKNGETGHFSVGEKGKLLSFICDEYGLNPTFVPFNFIMFQGKERLYLTKVGCDAIANNKQLTRTITTRHYDADTNIYTVSAIVSDGVRKEEASASVFCAGFDNKKQAYVRMTGEALANAYLKTESKAKRRATLAFIGFAFEEDSFESFDKVEPIARECEAKTKAIAEQSRDVKEEIKQEPAKKEVNHNIATYDATNNSHKMLIIKILKEVAKSEEWVKNSEIVKEVAEFSKSLHETPLEEVEKKTLVKGAYIFEYFNRENKIHLEIFHSIFNRLKTDDEYIIHYLSITSGTKENITTLFQDFHKQIPVNRVEDNMRRYCNDYLNAHFR